MTTSALSRAIYTALLEAFTEKPGNIMHAAKRAGCNRATARKAWNGEYSALPWAPCIRDVVEGRTPPPAPGLALVPKIDDPRVTRAIIRGAARKPPEPEPPSAPPLELEGEDDIEDDATEDGSEARTKSQHAALALSRRGLAARARALLTSGHKYDRFIEGLLAACAAYADDMLAHAKKGHVPSVKDLVSAAQVASMLTGVLKDLGASAEKITAAERKLNPPAPKRSRNGNMTPEEAQAKARAQYARWQRLFGNAPAPDSEPEPTPEAAGG